MFKIFRCIVMGVRKCWLMPVTIYKKFISPLKPPCCRFTPSCSEYAQTAVMTHGIIIGTCLSVYRIIRCNPFGGFGDDPVPEYGFFPWERFVLKMKKNESDSSKNIT